MKNPRPQLTPQHPAFDSTPVASSFIRPPAAARPGAPSGQSSTGRALDSPCEGHDRRVRETQATTPFLRQQQSLRPLSRNTYGAVRKCTSWRVVQSTLKQTQGGPEELRGGEDHE